MDKLNTELYGGFPFELDDWRWELEEHRRVLINIGLGIGGYAPFVLSGCEYTVNGGGGVLTINPGWVCVLGEARYYPGGAGNPAFNADQHYFLSDNALAAAGTEVFEDGTTQDTYLLRRIKVLIDPGGNSSSLLRLPRLRDMLAPGAWVPVTDFFTGWSAPDGLQCRHEPGGLVRLRGTLIYSGPDIAATGTIGTCLLPAGYRPLGGVVKAVGVFPFQDVPRLVNISNVGNIAVYAVNTGIGTGTKVYLQDVTFSTA